jgi:endonuclease/exonuclease/phosphatase family metal-dependent hydrolase
LLVLLVVALLVPLPRATGVGAQPPVASTAGRPHPPGLSRMVVVDHNVERPLSAVTAALQRAAQAHARVVTLQEVCWWQVRDLRAQHPDWSVAYLPDTHSGRCRTGLGIGALQGRDDSGNVVVWTGGSRAAASTHVFGSQPRRTFRQGLACLHWRASVPIDVCSTHLVHDGEKRALRQVQVRQAREVGDHVRHWIRRGHLVVVGGDLNAAPSSRPLDYLYRVNGQGRFVESTRCPRTVDLCRRSRGVTLDRGHQKIDYVFFSVNRTPPGSPHGLTLTHTLSDHHLLTGWAYVDLRPRQRRTRDRA